MGTTTLRLTVGLTKGDSQRLDELKDHPGESKAQVIKRAISILHILEIAIKEVNKHANAN